MNKVSYWLYLVISLGMAASWLFGLPYLATWLSCCLVVVVGSILRWDKSI